MMWTLILVGAGYILIKFFLALNKDNHDLENQSLPEKFAVIVVALNEAVYDSKGRVKILDKREFNLYEEGKSQIIWFKYSTGHLNIIWKYKYFQKEVVHEKLFENVRNLSIFEQQKIANIFIAEMVMIGEMHRINVLNDIS